MLQLNKLQFRLSRGHVNVFLMKSNLGTDHFKEGRCLLYGKGLYSVNNLI